MGLGTNPHAPEAQNRQSTVVHFPLVFLVNFEKKSKSSKFEAPEVGLFALGLYVGALASAHNERA